MAAASSAAQNGTSCCSGHVCCKKGSPKVLFLTLLRGLFTIGGLLLLQPAIKVRFSPEIEAERSEIAENPIFDERFKEQWLLDHLSDEDCDSHFGYVWTTVVLLGICKAFVVPKKLFRDATELTNEGLFDSPGEVNRERNARITLYAYLLVQETAITMPYDRYYATVSGTDSFYCPRPGDFGGIGYRLAPLASFIMVVFTLSSWAAIASNGKCGLCCTCPGWKTDFYRNQQQWQDVQDPAEKACLRCSCVQCTFLSVFFVTVCGLIEAFGPFFNMPDLSLETFASTLVSTLGFIVFPFDIMHLPDLSQLSKTGVWSMLLTAAGNLLSLWLLFSSFQGHFACQRHPASADHGQEEGAVIANSEILPRGREISGARQETVELELEQSKPAL
eukprot:TRINITY_DN78857_c0_g1_i1.p1 TRINITY_DN78857_c0_g1~~TRINITY_DN78857_c0_g1_i1.p1  ORF type:complete len:389 (-),score=69.35 TRINITY_DN78857_c0_g1_i1:181-1347(-)